MEKLTLEGTEKTPTVNFDPAGTLELGGRSIPENSVQFYEPIFNWLDDYAAQPQSTTTVNIKLEYFNTSSSKCILDVFKKLQKIHDNGNTVNVNWYYEEDDDDMLEAGEDYQEITGIPFKLVEVEDLY